MVSINWYCNKLCLDGEKVLIVCELKGDVKVEVKVKKDVEK